MLSLANASKGDQISNVTRTLAAAGFHIEGLSRHPAYAELRCKRTTLLGVEVRMVVALSHSSSFSPEAIEDLRRFAVGRNRELVLVASERTEGVMSYDDVFQAVGGEVPSWRALTPSYGEMLTITASNAVPEGEAGEAWFLFECLVRDGLEFCLGRRAYHHGGARRGKAVSDVIALLPDHSLRVVDAKATSRSFNASITELRPLGEYFRRQKDIQRGHNEVGGALVVSSSFAQDAESLSEISLEFNARYGGPVAFMCADRLADMVQVLSRRSDLRNAIRWRRGFRGGFVSEALFVEEIQDADQERVSLE